MISTGHFLPGVRVGGPLTSITNLIDACHGTYSFRVVTTNRDFHETKPYQNIPCHEWINRESYLVYYLNCNRNRIRQLIKVVRSSQPDFLYLNPLLDPVFSISLALLKRIGGLPETDIVIAPRGELFNEALSFKPIKKRAFLTVARLIRLYENVYFHATNELERDCIVSRLNVHANRVKVARVISPQPKLPQSDAQLFPTTGMLKIVFLARISKDKNLGFVFDVLRMVPEAIRIRLDIYGPIEDQFIWNDCQAKIARLPPNIEVNYLGWLDKSLVRKTLVQYDLFFMPTFAENYGHSIAEALSVGTPVLISDKTPWRNLENRGLGWDLPLGNVEPFLKAIVSNAILKWDDRVQLRRDIECKALAILNDPCIISENLDLFRAW